MVIRNACPKDVAGLKNVKPSLEKETIDKRLREQAKNKAEFLVLEENGHIVSFVFLKYYGKDTHPDYPDMENLHTRKNKRRKGYGSALVKECEKRSRKKGFTRIGLAVNSEQNKSARMLYEKLGYKHDGKNQYLDDVYNGVEDWCIDMEKELK